MAEFLNLDDIAPQGKSFVFRGVEYQVGMMSVGAFVRLNASLKEMRISAEKGKEVGIEEQIEVYTIALLDVVQNITREDIHMMTMEQMQTLIGFAQSQGNAAAEENATGKE